MRSVLPILLALAACGEPPTLPGAPATAAATVAATMDAARLEGVDPILADARKAIARGALAPDARARLDASPTPLHARAVALLDAIDRDRPAPRPEPPASADPPKSSVAIAVTPPPTDAPLATPTPARAPEAAPPAARPAAPRVVATLEKLSLRGSGTKSTLSIDAGQGMVVGVAAQPGAGLVRLVIKDVRAGAAVLAARPKAAGARVVDVDAGPNSVRITLALDDGWRVVATRRTSTGAKVELAQS